MLWVQANHYPSGGIYCPAYCVLFSFPTSSTWALQPWQQDRYIRCTRCGEWPARNKNSSKEQKLFFAYTLATTDDIFGKFLCKLMLLLEQQRAASVSLEW